MLFNWGQGSKFCQYGEMEKEGGMGEGCVAYPCGDVSVWLLRDTAELHNDGNEIEQSGNGGIEQLLKEKCFLRSGNRVEVWVHGEEGGDHSFSKIWPS